LKPFFQEPIDDSILPRYALTQSGSLADVHPRKSVLVAEQAAPADPENDLNFQFTIEGIRAVSLGADKKIVDYVGYGDEDEAAPGEEITIVLPSPTTPKN
jgi:hypothetical protein